MATIDDLRERGFTVGLSFEGEGFSVYRVEGYGLSAQVRDDDEEAIERLLVAHPELAAQEGETAEETLLRWDADPETDVELDPEYRDVLQERVAAASADA